MKIAIPASQRKNDSLIDARFGRCPFFCFYDTENKKVEFKENILKDAVEGAGPQVAEFLAERGIKEVYVTEIGPKAQITLDKLKIKTNIINAGLSVKQVINLITN